MKYSAKGERIILIKEFIDIIYLELPPNMYPSPNISLFPIPLSTDAFYAYSCHVVWLKYLSGFISTLNRIRRNCISKKSERSSEILMVCKKKNRSNSLNSFILILLG
ncbi:MAG: hypothetical protein COA79_06015 [Planctomycetota bacterium]|nr:MAG: hypothetical protein COA79_06015 [Planctomycetota bacterium]